MSKIKTLIIIAGALGASVLLSAQTFTSLYSFTSQDGNGYLPQAAVTIGPQGQLYGTTYSGGAYKYGTVYQLTPPASPGAAWTETVLHSFNAQSSDAHPNTTLALGSSGALYGVSGWSFGGYFGAVYQLLPPSAPSTHWTESILYQFTNGADGASPEAGLVIGPHQALYGTTASGVGSTYGGTIFRVNPPSAAGGKWTETTLWGFAQEAGGLSGSRGTLLLQNGAIYGTTQSGGTGLSGAVFQSTPPTSLGGSWTEAQLYSFSGANGDGMLPYAGVVMDANGVLYGTTEEGGPKGGDCTFASCGTVFSLTPPATPAGQWTESILHAFTGMNGDGAHPYAGVVLGAGGVLYGTTYDGGNDQACGGGCGSVFELVPPSSPGGMWNEVILHSFDGTDGRAPYGLTLASDGTIYGITAYGGVNNQGTVFQIVQ